ncbi:hypothetical protein EC950183_4784, partial [Escherichia coli 95.0183]
MVDYS